ncbi:hypothetical protein BSKO_13348 [Bryopsis sp. KO-2023]|nr:hypothetical protein BSKO_13348 [Bryopsis sp. KO-2023]
MSSILLVRCCILFAAFCFLLPISEGNGSSHLDRNLLQAEIMTDLHRAVMDGDVEKVNALIEQGEDINSEVAGAVTPLHLTSFNTETSIAGALLQAGADIDAVSGVLGTPLHWALYLGNHLIADMMILNGASVDIENQDEKVPFDVVCLCSLQQPLVDLFSEVVECVGEDCEIPKSVLIDSDVKELLAPVAEPDDEDIIAELLDD